MRYIRNARIKEIWNLKDSSNARFMTAFFNGRKAVRGRALFLLRGLAGSVNLPL